MWIDYDRLFDSKVQAGHSSTDAAVVTAEAYLDGKPHRGANWTASEKFPRGNPRAAEAILDFWTSAGARWKTDSAKGRRASIRSSSSGRF